MRPSLQRVKTLEVRLIGLEMELKLMSNDLAIVQYNISQLVQMEKTYTYNVKLLKKDKIITIASEYKNSIETLKATKESLQTYYDLEANFKHRIVEGEKIHEEFTEAYTSAKKQLEEDKIILIFDPKKRRKK